MYVNSLDPELGPNCLHKLLADGIGTERVNMLIDHIDCNEVE